MICIWQIICVEALGNQLIFGNADAPAEVIGRRKEQGKDMKKRKLHTDSKNIEEQQKEKFKCQKKIAQ